MPSSFTQSLCLASLLASPLVLSAELRVEQNENQNSLSVYRLGQATPLLTHETGANQRPFIHPLTSPDAKSALTGTSGESTGIFWAFPSVNGRDYFSHSGQGYWQRQAVSVILSKGDAVSWQTVYELLDSTGKPIMEETQNWSMQDSGARYELDVEWSGEAKTDLTIAESDFGGLYVQSNWQSGRTAEVVNAARQRNQDADGQPAMWADMGIQVPGQDALAHIAIFDHPNNPEFPQRWHVSDSFGFGPVRARTDAWTLDEGEMTLLKHRLLIHSGPLNDVDITQDWSEYSGLGGTWALWSIAQREGREAEFLTPERAIEEMTIHDGFQINAFASEPMMTQPMAFCWDDRGRLWIAENRDYESRGRGFANSGDSRILILEDTDRDGKADKRIVFSEGIPFPAAIAVGFDGLWLGAPPNLLFLPDRDGDDRADEDIEIRLTGWGIRDRHETLNSFHWGPDGWLYGCQGFATPSKVGKPLGKGKIYQHRDPFPDDIELENGGTDINGGVWRYHPTKDRFEVVAHGFSNPWGIDYDAKGQLFISACVIPHLWHVVPGGIYHRQGGRHYNPYVYSDIRTIVDHRHRSAHGGARVYLSDAFPKSYHGKLFMANIHEHAVLTDVLEPVGSGFVAHHGDDFMLANNAQWIGFSVEIGPEGGLYVLDWHDADICGKEVINKDTGRVFRITPKDSAAEDFPNRYDDLDTLPDGILVGFQTSESSWHARRARVVLQKRAHKSELSQETHKQLWELFNQSDNGDHKLRALWCLHVTQGLNELKLLPMLKHQDPYVRAWAIQILTEDHSPSMTAIVAFTRMAASDSSPVVRLYLAAALQRIPEDSRWALIQALVQHGDDNDDHNIPKMIWFATEPLVAKDPERALTLAAESQLELIVQYIARRVADAENYDGLIKGIANVKTPAIQVGLLQGFLHGLEGRIDVKAPTNWAALYSNLQQINHPEVQNLSRVIAQLFGDVEAAKSMFAELNNHAASNESRQQALRGLASQKRPELRNQLVSLLDQPALRMDAIRAITAYDDSRLARELLQKYPQFDNNEKIATLQTLSARSRSGRMLTDAIRSGTITKREVPAYIARQLRRVVGNGFVEVWGPIEQLSAEKQIAFTKYRALLTEPAINKANASKGRALFNQACGVCHRMYDDGGQVGPDITGADRTNLTYLLDNILNPSGEIQDDYKLVMITTGDGRSYAGNIAAENDRQLTLRTIGQDIVLNQSEIQSREVAPISMMPEGLLEQLSDQEVLDLTAYLQSTEQVSHP